MFTLQDDFYTKTWFLFDVVFNGVCCLFGIVGNLISLKVLYRLKDHKSTVYLLTALAVVDLLFLLYITVSRVIPGACLAAGYPDCHTAIFQGFWISWPLGCMVQTAGTWLIVAITCDRYIAVRFPFKAIAWNMPKKIKRVIVAILLAAVLLNIPRFFDGPEMIYEAKQCNKTGQDENTALCKEQEVEAFAKHSEYADTEETRPNFIESPKNVREPTSNTTPKDWSRLVVTTGKSPVEDINTSQKALSDNGKYIMPDVRNKKDLLKMSTPLSKDTWVDADVWPAISLTTPLGESLSSEGNTAQDDQLITSGSKPKHPYWM